MTVSPNAHDLFEIAGGHDHGITLLAEITHDPVDVGTRSDINAPRRLVHHQHPGWPATDAAAEGQLLLVAAAHFIRRREQPPPVDAHLPREGSRRRPKGPTPQYAAADIVGQPRCDQVVVHAQPAEDSLLGAIARDEHDVAPERARG